MNQIIKNYIYNASFQVLSIVLPLITTPYVSRVLQADGVGAYGYTQSITQYFILLGSVGLSMYGQREIAYHQQDEYNRSKIFKEVLLLKILTTTISLSFFFFTQVAPESHYQLLFTIQAIDIFSIMIDTSWFFQGMEEFKKIVIRNFIIKITGVILIFIFVKTPDDVWIYALINSLAILLGNLSMWLYLPIFIIRVPFSKLNLIKHLRPNLALFLPQIAASLYTVLDKTMLGFIGKIDAEVGYYEQSQKIVKTVLALVTSVATVMMPRIANSFALGQKELVNEYMCKSYRITFMMTIPMTIGLMCTAAGLVPWFFGAGYDKVTPNIVIIAPIIIMIGIASVTGTQYLISTQRQRQYTIAVFCGAALNVLCNIILIPILLSLGAAIATLIAEAVGAMVQLYFVRREFSPTMIFNYAKPYILASIPMALVCLFVSSLLNYSILSSFIVISAGAITYIGILILLKDTVILNSLQKVKERIFKKNL